MGKVARDEGECARGAAVDVVSACQLADEGVDFRGAAVNCTGCSASRSLTKVREEWEMQYNSIETMDIKYLQDQVQRRWSRIDNTLTNHCNRGIKTSPGFLPLVVSPLSSLSCVRLVLSITLNKRQRHHLLCRIHLIGGTWKTKITPR